MTSRQKPLTFSYAGRGPTRTTPTRPHHSPRSEALECVQLAAAFPSASLLAAVSSRKLSCGNLHPRLGLYSHSFPASTSASQRAGWRKSGSKLHALQSFAPYALTSCGLRRVRE